MRPKSTATYKPTVKLTYHRGFYKVQSGTNPNTWYGTSANSCTCPARKPCKHMRYVRSLNIAFYVAKKPTAPAVASTPPARSTLDAQVDAAEARLAHARRALHDADQRDDSYAVLWRQMDTLEREVAALHYASMRAA